MSFYESPNGQPAPDYEVAARATRELGLRAAALLVASTVEPDLIIIPRRRVKVEPKGPLSQIDNDEPRIHFGWWRRKARHYNEDGEPIRAWEMEGETIGTTAQRPQMPLALNEDGVYDVERRLFLVEGRGLRQTTLMGRLHRPEPFSDITGILGSLYKDDEAGISIAASLRQHWADAFKVHATVFDTAEHEGWLQDDIVTFLGSRDIRLPDAP